MLIDFSKPLPHRVHRLDLPDCGSDAHICVRSLTVAELNSIQKEFAGQEPIDLEAFNARLLACTLCDDQGQSVFGGDADKCKEAFGQLAIQDARSIVEFAAHHSALETKKNNSPAQN